MRLGLKFCFLFLATLLPSCTSQTSASSSGSSAYDIVSEQSVMLKDCLSQPEEQYLVYFYSDNCSACLEIKQEVISFANSNILKTYFLNTREPGNEIQKCTPEEIVLGVDKVEDLYVLGTPTLIEVENGTTTANVGGKNACLGLLNSLKENHQTA